MYCVCIEDTQHSINTLQASRLLGLSVLWFFFLLGFYFLMLLDSILFYFRWKGDCMYMYGSIRPKLIMPRNAKTCLGNMLTANAQIRLTRPLLSANRIIGHYRSINREQMPGCNVAHALYKSVHFARTRFRLARPNWTTLKDNVNFIHCDNFPSNDV